MHGRADMQDQDCPELDVTGLRCPLPVLKARGFFLRFAPGTRVRVRADDPLARIDLPDLCQREGHGVISERLDGPVIVFDITIGPVEQAG